MIRPVVGWEGLYEISDSGEVRSLPRVRRVRLGTRNIPGRVVVPLLVRGYLVVTLKDRERTAQRFLHHLVLEAFGEARPDGAQCRHLDGDSTNNHLSNLAWGTALENAGDRIEHGTQARGTSHGIARLDPARVLAIREMSAAGASARCIADAFGVGRTTVQAILSGRTWSHVVSA